MKYLILIGINLIKCRIILLQCHIVLLSNIKTKIPLSKMYIQFAAVKKLIVDYKSYSRIPLLVHGFDYDQEQCSVCCSDCVVFQTSLC